MANAECNTAWKWMNNKIIVRQIGIHECMGHNSKLPTDVTNIITEYDTSLTLKWFRDLAMYTWEQIKGVEPCSTCVLNGLGRNTVKWQSWVTYNTICVNNHFEIYVTTVKGVCNWDRYYVLHEEIDDLDCSEDETKDVEKKPHVTMTNQFFGLQEDTFTELSLTNIHVKPYIDTFGKHTRQFKNKLYKNISELERPWQP